MPAPSSFDYAVIRVVPRVEREEFVNAGIVLFCLQQRFLQARIHIDELRLLSLWPRLDLETIRRHLEAFPSICAGDPSAGPISQLSQRERFHWLVSPRSTVIQVSPVHTGLCDTAEDIMGNLVQRYLVL
jgi:hypothetical protein